MVHNTLQQAPGYDPNRLLDTVIDLLGLGNDAALSRALGIWASHLSSMRRHREPVGAGLLIRLHEETGLTVAQLRKLMGDRRKKFRARELRADERRDGLGAQAGQRAHRNRTVLGPTEQPSPIQRVTHTRRRPFPGDALYAITRQGRNPKGSACWKVQISRHGKTYAARFYDHAYPDAGLVLAAAQAFRDAVLALVPQRRTHANDVAALPETAVIKEIERDVRIRFGEHALTGKES
jgi:hypothetical protein